MDITTMKPTQLLVYSITGSQELGIIGTATAAAQQTIANARSLTNGSDLLSGLTEKSMGKSTDPTPAEPSPLPNKSYSKWEIAKKMSAIADAISTEKDPQKISQLQAQLNVWSSQNGLNDTQLQIASGEFTSMNKALEQNVQQDQANLQQIVQLGSTAVGNQSYANGLIQQSF